MLETQIKALSEAVQANTAALEKVLVALTSADVKPQVKANAKPGAETESDAKADTKAKGKIAKAKPAVKPEPKTTDTDTDTTADIVTANDLKQLARDAIAEGVLRTAIKKLITDTGADTISSLDDKQRVEVYNALAKLRGE